jgi:hypothetical protein
MPFMGHGNGIRNAELECDMQQGLPTRLFTQKFKTNGYTNPVEHFYDYISDDIQQVDHVVMDLPRGGISTRLDNKSKIERGTVNTSYRRDVL